MPNQINVIAPYWLDSVQTWVFGKVIAATNAVYSLGAVSFLVSRFFCRRSRREAACFSRLAFRLTFFFASISFRFEIVAGFVVAMIFQMPIIRKNVQ
jgi:hypothetical protein